jgi:hypothetical protein
VHLLPQRRRRRRPRVAHVRLLEADQPARAHAGRGRAQRRDGIRQVHVDEPADHRVKAVLDAVERLDVAHAELDVGGAEPARPVPRLGDGLGIGVDADQRAVRADDAGGEQGHVAGAAAQVEDARTGREPGVREEARGDRVEDAALRAQALLLGRAVPEEVLGLLGHRPCATAG